MSRMNGKKIQHSVVLIVDAATKLFTVWVCVWRLKGLTRDGAAAESVSRDEFVGADGDRGNPFSLSS